MEKLIACRSKGVGREWGREEGERVKRKNQKTTLEKGFFIQHFKNILIPTKRSTDRIEGSKQGKATCGGQLPGGAFFLLCSYHVGS